MNLEYGAVVFWVSMIIFTGLILLALTEIHSKLGDILRELKRRRKDD